MLPRLVQFTAIEVFPDYDAFANYNSFVELLSLNFKNFPTNGMLFSNLQLNDVYKSFPDKNSVRYSFPCAALKKSWLSLNHMRSLLGMIFIQVCHFQAL